MKHSNRKPRVFYAIKSTLNIAFLFILVSAVNASVPVELRHSRIMNISKIYSISFDQGENWQEVAIPCQSHILGAYFFNPDSGFVFGASGACYYTDDHGLSMLERSAFVDNNLHGGAFRDAETGLVCGSDGIILKTTNGGENWRIVNELLGITLFGIAFVDSSSLICVGQEGVILRSEDNGDNWSRAEMNQTTTNANLFYIDKSDRASLLIAGGAGMVLESEDIGKSWRKTDISFEPVKNRSNENTEHKESLSKRFLAEIQAALGTPYAGFCLGEGESGLFDRDPRCDFSRVDCVTLVEQSLALALADRHSMVLDNLDHIRYKGGRVGFLSRNHFFAAEWIQSNSWILEDVTCNLGGEAVEHLTRTVDRQKFLKLVAPDVSFPNYKNLENFTISYIPSSAVASALAKMDKLLIVSFIGKEPNWLFSAHVGVINSNSKGKIMLYHASSDKKMVVEDDFLNYIQQHQRIIGIKVLQLSD